MKGRVASSGFKLVLLEWKLELELVTMWQIAHSGEPTFVGCARCNHQQRAFPFSTCPTNGFLDSVHLCAAEKLTCCCSGFAFTADSVLKRLTCVCKYKAPVWKRANVAASAEPTSRPVRRFGATMNLNAVMAKL